MQLRRFQADDISSALKMIKEELGSDAIILDTKKKVRKDPSTGKKKNYVEVIAAIDRHQEEEIFSPSKKHSFEQGIVRNILDEIRSLKDEINRLAKYINKTDSYENEIIIEDIDKLQSLFSGLGLDRKSEIRLIKKLYPKGLKQPERFFLRLRQYICSNLQLGPTAEKQKNRCWWAVVGPTGVGKTTTLAKIAARLKFLCGKTGILVSVDSYKLGAIEQLQKFASLMEIPLETARTNKELLKIFSDNQDKDFILVDTTGRNPFSSSHKTELERLFDSIPGLMAQVMLSATSKREDLMESIGFYKQFPVAGWTLTKIDETRFLVSSLLPIIEAGLPLSYVTNGQRVPEDIKIPKATEIAGLAVAPIAKADTGQSNIETRIRNLNVV